VIEVEAIELRVTLAALPAPQGIATMNAAGPAMLDCSTRGPERIRLRVDAFRKLEWMGRKERETYEKMVDDLKNATRRNRLIEEMEDLSARRDD
jgi:hypothetical protein